MKWFRMLAVLTLCISSLAYAEWNPSFLLQDESKSLDILNNRKYADLKAKVIQELKNSWCSAEKINLLMDLTLLTHPKICVEIGAFTGSSVLPVATTLKYLNSGKIFAVDAWSNAEATKYLADNDPNKQWWSQLDMQSVHNSYQHLINKWSLRNFCAEIFKPSAQAVFDIPSEIDFLHLDGNFSERGALEDAELYLPKVKSGGYILLSNFYLMIGREQPKMKAFVALCDACEVVASIENDNAVLFKKN
ncbi:MAG: Methyltransferase domain [Chlamydiota bacterium]|jgi:hypothetical protein